MCLLRTQSRPFLYGGAHVDTSELAYNTSDLTASCDSRVYFASRVVPVGTLVHTTFGVSSAAWLLGGSAQDGQAASADYLIDRRGQRIKICPDGFRPYHAGSSQYEVRGRWLRGDELSAALLGVELECSPSQSCTWHQLNSLAELIVHLSDAFSWRFPYYVLGHYEVARPYGRRSDPHGFDWGDFMGRLIYQARLRGAPGI